MRPIRFGLAVLVAATMLILAGAAVARDLRAVPHQVLAFYYGWYLDNTWTQRARWTPVEGAYRSNDRKTVDAQIAEARKAGITGFITSWWPDRGTYTDKQFPMLLQAAQAGGMKITAVIEQFGEKAHLKKVERATVVSDVDYIFDHYGDNPAWLKVAGRPVLFVYSRAAAQLPSEAEWNAALKEIRKAHPGAIVLSDQQDNVFYNPWDKADFDGLFDYEIVSRQKGKTPAAITADIVKRDKTLVAISKARNITTLTVMPGYDDTKTGRAVPRPIMERADGGTYAATWQAAIAARPDWVLVTSYNEWLEGTQIEPSKEFGESAIDETAKFSKQFLAAPPR